jgi:hypothetical protein
MEYGQDWDCLGSMYELLSGCKLSKEENIREGSRRPGVGSQLLRLYVAVWKQRICRKN